MVPVQHFVGGNYGLFFSRTRAVSQAAQSSFVIRGAPLGATLVNRIRPMYSIDADFRWSLLRLRLRQNVNNATL